MKTLKILAVVAVICIVAVSFIWMGTRHLSKSGNTEIGGRKPLYYTCAMHPWVRESKPGACPVCGMNLTPVYEIGGTATTDSNNISAGSVTLESESVNVIGLETDSVERRPVRRSLHLSGQISGNSKESAWFEFTVYQRDLEWFKACEVLEVQVTGVPDKTYTAQIKRRGTKPDVDKDFDMMTTSTTMRAEISNPPVEIGDFDKDILFSGLHADAHLVAETEPTQTIPRSSIISRGLGATVYVDNGNGRYAPRTVELGRIGDELAEVLSGLKEGEKVVTSGNVLIDSEAQLTTSQ